MSLSNGRVTEVIGIPYQIQTVPGWYVAVRYASDESRGETVIYFKTKKRACNVKIGDCLKDLKK